VPYNDVVDEEGPPDEARSVGLTESVMLAVNIGSAGALSVDDDAPALPFQAVEIALIPFSVSFFGSRSCLAGEDLANVLRKVTRYDLPADDLTGVPFRAPPVPGCDGLSGRARGEVIVRRLSACNEI
jgi:hypothetical protein